MFRRFGCGCLELGREANLWVRVDGEDGANIIFTLLSVRALPNTHALSHTGVAAHTDFQFAFRLTGTVESVHSQRVVSPKSSG